MLTKEQKNLGMRYAMLCVLNTDIARQDYSCLQQLYEFDHIDNKRLVKRLHEHRFIAYSPKDTIFTDMAHIIFEDSKDNPAIIETFSGIYSKKYPDITQKIAFIEKQYERNIQEIKNPLQSKYPSYYYFGLFLIFRSDILPDCEMFGFDFNEFCSMVTFALLTTDYNLNDENYIFNSGEEIFTSPQYTRFLKKRKEELVEVANKYYKDKEITTDNLAKSLEDVLILKSDSMHTRLNATIDDIVTNSARDLLIENYCGAVWYRQVTSMPDKTKEYALGYRPDIDELIDLYYKNVVKNTCRRYMTESKGESISKIYLARECTTGSPLTDLISIMYMYNLSIYCKLFTTLLEDYYTNFSWEKLTRKSLSIRYENIISSLQGQINVYVDKISLLTEQNSMLRQQISKNTNADMLPYERTITDLNKKIANKDSEIALLKQQLESKERYIELLSSVDDPEIQEEVNLDKLKEKRYLFVGHIKEALPQLYREFPNSLFMENENFSLQNIKVDGIVMLIKYMSHAQFYKINSTASLSDTPIIRCNTKNINTIYNVMNSL